MGTNHTVSSRSYRNVRFLKFCHLGYKIVDFVTRDTKLWILSPRIRNCEFYHLKPKFHGLKLGVFKIPYFGIFGESGSILEGLDRNFLQVLCIWNKYYVLFIGLFLKPKNLSSKVLVSLALVLDCPVPFC
jgi:hypothetical protein